jgi:hypothetical protein
MTVFFVSKTDDGRRRKSDTTKQEPTTQLAPSTTYTVTHAYLSFATLRHAYLELAI